MPKASLLLCLEAVPSIILEQAAGSISHTRHGHKNTATTARKPKPTAGQRNTRTVVTHTVTLSNQAFSSNTAFPYPSPPFPEQLPPHNQPGTTLRSLLGFRTARARVARERGVGPGGLRAPSLPVRAPGQRHSCGFCHPARAFGGADGQRSTAPEGHTPTHSCRKAYRGRLELGRGRTEGRQGSFISFHWDYAFQIFKGTS